MNKTNTVIAICSPSGGGKTSLIHMLSDLIEDSVTIHFDDYGDPFWNISDFDEWIKQGADLNKVNTRRLAEDLESLKNGKSIISPKNQKVVEPEKYILFDSLVGRAQSESGALIDFLVYIDVPLELALSRRILRMLDETQDDNQKVNILHEYIKAYSGLAGPRQIYKAIENQVKPLSDLILDGETTIKTSAENLMADLRKSRIIL